MTNDIDPRHIGSSFQDWLDQEGIAEEVHDLALKSLIQDWLIKEYALVSSELEKMFAVKQGTLIIHDRDIERYLDEIEDYLTEIGVDR